jgi:hypothetical protein
MSEEFTDSELEAYLDEGLDAERAASLEKQMRENPKLIKKLSLINARRDAGLHTLGEIWRRFEIGVPTRDQLAGYLTGTLDDPWMDYIRYRIEILKCPFTIANVNDLREQQQHSSDAKLRQERLFKLSKRVNESSDLD